MSDDSPVAIIYDSNGNAATIKPTSIPATVTDPALVIAISPNSPVPAGTNMIGTVNLGSQPDLFTSGSISATDAIVATPTGNGALLSGISTTGSYVFLTCTGGTSSWLLQLSGNFGGGTIFYEISTDSTNGTDGNWIIVNGRQTGVTNTVLGFSTTIAGNFRGNVSGAKYFRARMIGATSPNVSVTIRSSAGVGAVFLNSSLPGGTNTIGSVRVTDADGNASNIFPAGFLRISDEPRQIFYDPFDSALDTTNRWISPTSSGGGGAASTTAGTMILGSGTTASGYSYLQSTPNFVPTVPAWLGYSFAISIEFPVQNNANRFWGCGTSPVTPTTAIPITNGVGFELDTAGKLCTVVYSNGTRNQIADLSSSGTNTQPVDSNNHRYIIYYRTDRIFFYIDSLATPVATSNFQAPQIQTLPLKLASTASSSAPAASRVINCTGLAVWDTGKNNTQLSDGTFPWRKSTIDTKGNIQTKLNSSTATSTTVAILTSSTNLLVLNLNRLGATLYNDGSFNVYVKLGTAASTTSYSVQIVPNGYYEIPYGYTGNIDAIFVGAGSVNVRITEIT